MGWKLEGDVSLRVPPPRGRWWRISCVSGNNPVKKERCPAAIAYPEKMRRGGLCAPVRGALRLGAQEVHAH